MTREVPAGEWQAVLERFGGEHRSWLATIHIVDGRGTVSRFARRPIKSAAAKGDAVRLEFLDERPSVCAWQPSGMRIQEIEPGLTQAMEIDTVDGQLIRVAFRAMARPEQLDGVAPGELPAHEGHIGTARPKEEALP
jgi:hypothetical protein